MTQATSVSAVIGADLDALDGKPELAPAAAVSVRAGPGT